MSAQTLRTLNAALRLAHSRDPFARYPTSPDDGDVETLARTEPLVLEMLIEAHTEIEGLKARLEGGR